MFFILPYRRSHPVAAFGSVGDGIKSAASGCDVVREKPNKS
jgi:hypothetical protein